MVVDRSRDAYAARLCQHLQPGCDVDAVAEDVVVLNDDVAKVDAHAKPDTPLNRHLRLALGHAALDLHSAAHGVDNARDLLIGALEASGQRGEAARQYRRCRETLKDELGIEPDPETEELAT